MLWKHLAWFLLAAHFFDEPFREQILAVQTLVCHVSRPKTIAHRDFFCDCHLLCANTTRMAIVVTMYTPCCSRVLYYSEYFIKDWNFWPWLLLCWSIRWLSSVNMYHQHPLRASLRCIIFGMVAQKRFARTFQDGFKWCWILLVHECTLILLPFQMLLKYTRESLFDICSIKRCLTMEVHVFILSTMSPETTSMYLNVQHLEYEYTDSIQRFQWKRQNKAGISVTVWVACQSPLINELIGNTLTHMDACICLYQTMMHFLSKNAQGHATIGNVQRKHISYDDNDATLLNKHKSKVQKFYNKDGFERKGLQEH